MEMCPLPGMIVFNQEQLQHTEIGVDLSLALLQPNMTKEKYGHTLWKSRDKFYEIPCSWSVPLKASVNFDKCVGEFSVKGVLWGTYGNIFSNNLYVEKLKESVRKVTLSAPSVSRVLDCKSSSQNRTTEEKHKVFDSHTDSCAFYRYIASLKRRTHLYYLGNTHQFNLKYIRPAGEETNVNNTKEFEVSLLVQASLDRFTVLERVLMNWKGPAVVVLHVTDDEAATLPLRIKQSEGLSNRRNIDYHVVYKTRGFNTINVLRNVAMDNTHTPYAFTLDVDLVPNPDIYESIKKNLELNRSSKELLVVPAFEALSDLGYRLPTNKEQMLKMIANEEVVGYGTKKGWDLGHRPTNYTFWKIATFPYLAIYADWFEPYVVVKMDAAPRYNEMLLERMGDKVAYARLLHTNGFTFRVLNEDYLIHLPHPKSPDKLRQMRDMKFHRCASLILEEYYNQLRHQASTRNV